MTRPLTDLLTRAEWPEPLVDRGLVERWPEGTLDQFVGLGLLAEGSPAAAVRCDACGLDHVEPVRWVEAPGVDRRPFVVCPEVGPVRLDPADLRQWVVQPPRLAQLVAASVGTVEVHELVAGRVWRLGKSAIHGRLAIVYLVRGLDWADAPGAVANVPALQTASAVVLVPAATPRPLVWGAGPVPPVSSLTDLLTWTGFDLELDRAFLAATVPTEPRAPAGAPLTTFPTPAGSSWADLTLVVGDEHVRATIGEVTRQFSFAAIGFADRRRSGTPDRVWALLRLFARHRGVLSREQEGVLEDGLKQTVSELVKRLRAIFMIDDKPVAFDRKRNEYRTRFSVAAEGGRAFALPPADGWEDLSLVELAPGRVEITIDRDERGAAFEAESGIWHATESAGALSRRLSLRELGLADEHDLPTPIGRVFQTLLRNRGVLGKEVPERDKLGLNRWLVQFFGLPEPFDVTPVTDRWAARFTADSRIRPGGQK